MDDNLLAMVIGLLVLVAGTCAIILIAVVGGIVVLTLFKRASETLRTPQYGSRDEFFAAEVPGLKAWQPGSLADLSNRWRGSYRQSGASNWAQGMIRSFAQPDENLIAFYVERAAFYDGTMHLRTSENEIVLSFTGGGASSGKATVIFDGEQLGWISLPEGMIHDAQAQPVGQHQRPKFWLGWIGTPPRYTPVILNGRSVAAIILMWQWHERKHQPALQNIAVDLSPQEQGWLLALAGLNLYSVYAR